MCSIKAVYLAKSHMKDLREAFNKSDSHHVCVSAFFTLYYAELPGDQFWWENRYFGDIVGLIVTTCGGIWTKFFFVLKLFFSLLFKTENETQIIITFLPLIFFYFKTKIKSHSFLVFFYYLCIFYTCFSKENLMPKRYTDHFGPWIFWSFNFFENADIENQKNDFVLIVYSTNNNKKKTSHLFVFVEQKDEHSFFSFVVSICFWNKT